MIAYEIKDKANLTDQKHSLRPASFFLYLIFKISISEECINSFFYSTKKENIARKQFFFFL